MSINFSRAVSRFIKNMLPISLFVKILRILNSWYESHHHMTNIIIIRISATIKF